MERYHRRFNNDSRYSLLEKTFQIDKDIDYIYDKVYKKCVEDFNKNKYHFIENKTIQTSELKCKDCIKANNINPCIIEVGVFDHPSFYSSGLHLIKITPDYEIVDYFVNHNEDQLDKYTSERYNNEITEFRLKSAIAHELSHWIHDSIFNRELTKYVKLRNILSSKDIAYIYEKHVNLTYFEIDAQIHALKQMQRKFSKTEWDSMTLTDLFIRYNSLGNLIVDLDRDCGKETCLIWQKYVVGRMSREHLLGKNMRKSADMKYIINFVTSKI